MRVLYNAENSEGVAHEIDHKGRGNQRQVSCI